MADKTYDNLTTEAQTANYSIGSDFLYTWRPLQYLNIYRICLAALLSALSITGHAPSPLGSYDIKLFLAVSLVYLASSLINILTIKWRSPSFNTQVYSQLSIDIIAITVLMHASGGVSSGLGMLLVITIAGGSMLMAGRTAQFFAALAALAVLAEQIYSHLGDRPTTVSYTQAGILGASFFATAMLARVLARRVRESEALAEKRGVDLANMAQLTEYVIQRMQTGIVVIDNQERIRLINVSAHFLLGMPVATSGLVLESISQELTEQLHHWQQNPDAEPQQFKAASTSPAIMPRFARLGTDKAAGTLIFLEDTAAATQQAQQMKLASLGRLTASIAHEVRNPLGAISHAGQLLKESPHLDESDIRLTEIIQNHSKRVNTIIENILRLSRRDRSNPEELQLKNWLQNFINEFCRSEQLTAEQITLDIEPEDTKVRIDPSQLHQIMWNLCQNGMRYSMENGNPKLELRGGITPDSRSPFLDIIDHGPGIKTDDAQQIFDPFFTTESSGTGLGLYISKELCESNQSRLNYLPVQGGGSCFRITFADPRRKQVA